MSRRKATPEQIAKAKEKRSKIREIAQRISKMSDEQRRAVVRDWPTTIEGHALSVHNACLLAYQTFGANSPTVVCGFRQWKRAGRFVRKGESGMSIWIPLGIHKSKDEETGEITETGERTGFGLATVFAISQTDEARTDEASGQPLYTESEVF